MHYIFKYVQLNIKLLRISPNTVVYVLIFTERIAETVNSPFLRRNNGYQSMRHLGTSLPSDYKRGLHIVSLEWTDISRANTLLDLFTVKGYN